MGIRLSPQRAEAATLLCLFSHPSYGCRLPLHNPSSHHASAAHLKRYVAEFDFCYNERSALGVNDAERATQALKGIVGKRLTYRRTSEARQA